MRPSRESRCRRDASRFRSRSLRLLPAVVGVGWVLLSVPPTCAQTSGTSLRFFGNGVGDIDRVKIRIDDPSTTVPGPPADVGATDFTIEFWLRAFAAENLASASGSGPTNAWINGNIVIDRDRYNQPRNYGISLGAGLVQFGVMGPTGEAFTLSGATDVRDGSWHHIAVQRRRVDGFLWVFVDGVVEAQVDGPDGDISYPDDGVPGDFCGGPCLNSDPFIVIAAEKHDAGPAYPSFAGWIDDLRISDTLRYGAPFTPAAAPFLSDAATVALYHFDEGAADAVADSSNHPLGPSPGVRNFGGSPAGPLWSLETPFTAPVSAPFRRGDCNGDGSLDIADVVTQLGVLFSGLAAPGCRSACDANDDDTFDISDPVRVLGVLFAAEPPLPPPSPNCGTDPTPGVTGCARFLACP
ncbi:MAG: LamG-like jellyroll fold domain-containing protein [Planctomycetota bacterium]